MTSTNVTTDNNFIISNENNFIFNIENKGIYLSCGNISFYKTSQSLYLTFDDTALELPKIENEFNMSYLIIDLFFLYWRKKVFLFLNRIYLRLIKLF